MLTTPQNETLVNPEFTSLVNSVVFAFDYYCLKSYFVTEYYDLMTGLKIPEQYFDKMAALQLSINESGIFDYLGKCNRFRLNIEVPNEERTNIKPATIDILTKLLKSRLMNCGRWMEYQDKYLAIGHEKVSLLPINIFNEPEVQQIYQELLNDLEIDDLKDIDTQYIIEKVLA